jgi:hypothetical protein
MKPCRKLIRRTIEAFAKHKVGERGREVICREGKSVAQVEGCEGLRKVRNGLVESRTRQR